MTQTNNLGLSTENHFTCSQFYNTEKKAEPIVNNVFHNDILSIWFQLFPLVCIQMWTLKCIKFQPVCLVPVSRSWEQSSGLKKVICAFEHNLQFSDLGDQ